MNRNSIRVTPPLFFKEMQRVQRQEVFKRGHFVHRLSQDSFKKNIYCNLPVGSARVALQSIVHGCIDQKLRWACVCRPSLYLQERSRRQTSHLIWQACVRGQVRKKSDNITSMLNPCPNVYIDRKILHLGVCTQMSILNVNAFVTSRGLRFVSYIQEFLIVPLNSRYVTLASYIRGVFC